jgi:zinc transporter
MTNPLLLHYIFDGKGGGENLLDKNINLFFSKKNFCWIHVDANNPIDVHNFFIKHKLEIDPIILNALLAEETRPRIEKNGDEALLILRGVNLNENELPEDMVSIRLWVTNNKIISARYRKLKAIGDIEDSIKSQKGPRNTGEFIFMLINALFTRIEPSVLNLDEETDLIEEQILDNPDIKLREKIINIRKKAIKFRRYMAPQRDVITKLCTYRFTWLTDLHLRYLQESNNNIIRYVEDLDAIRERAQIVKDEIANFLTDKMNKNLYILSVLTAIFLPLGFLTGLMGVNIAGMPGTQYLHAFWVFSFLLLIIVTIQILIFKKLKWF